MSNREPDPIGVEDIRVVAAIDRYGRVFQLTEEQVTITITGTLREIEQPVPAFSRIIARLSLISSMQGNSQ
ncbi:MAG: hypothetical protein DI547_17360 [Sphingobium sp.]|nr:MAG: hypothetical protein DI547_17360 [Sphingobium sp.]